MPHDDFTAHRDGLDQEEGPRRATLQLVGGDRLDVLVVLGTVEQANVGDNILLVAMFTNHDLHLVESHRGRGHSADVTEVAFLGHCVC